MKAVVVEYREFELNKLRPCVQTRFYISKEEGTVGIIEYAEEIPNGIGKGPVERNIRIVENEPFLHNVNYRTRVDEYDIGYLVLVQKYKYA